MNKNKIQFIRDYEDYILGSSRLNSRWIDNARSNNAALYLDIENSALKRLNDTIGDKSYVTALTNVHKDLVSSKINTLLKDYPNVEIEVYSDFKSVRYAFLPKNMPAELKDKLSRELGKVYSEANKEYADMLKTMEGIPGSEHPEKWFQAGLGMTADQAGQSAKKARKLERAGTITTFSEIEETLASEISQIKNYTDSLANSKHPLAQAGLVQRIPGTKSSTPSLQVFEVARKVKSPSHQDIEDLMLNGGTGLTHVEASRVIQGRDLANQLNAKFGTQLSIEDGQELLKYTNDLDSLTPGLWVKERIGANLNDASLGGMSGDVTGMGARNIRQVAYDVVASEKQDPSAILQATRSGEQQVTGVFDAIKRNFNDTVKRVMNERGIKYNDPCSGDDCVMVPDSLLSQADEKALVQAFTRQTNPSQYRLSFIPKGVAQENRTNLAVHGELVEKKLRSMLLGVGEGKIPHDQLTHVTMATRMPRSYLEGGVGLYLGVGEKANLTSEQRKLIQEKLKLAVSKVNEDLASEFPDQRINYSSADIDWLE